MRAKRSLWFRRGIGDGMCGRGRQTQHGKPHHVVKRKTHQPDAREGQAGRGGVAERLVVPLKSGNADGGKEPQFKTNARSGKGQEIGQPANSDKRSETADGVTCQSEGRTQVPVLPPVRQGSSTGRTRLCLPKLQSQQGSSRGGRSAFSLTLSGIDPLLLTKTDPPGRHGYARENAAHTAIPKRTRLYAASRVRCAGLQKPQPALDPAPRRKPGCWRAPTVGQFS
jgi:hypothetical protein